MNATAIVAARGAADPDAELIDLVDQYLEVARLDREADDHYETLQEQYNACEPKAPAAIGWNLLDDFDLEYHKMMLPGGNKCGLIYTDESVAELGSMRLERRRPRVPLWTPSRKKRADTVIAAHAPICRSERSAES